MKKSVFIIIFLLFLAGNVTAMDNIFIGIGPEVNQYTRSGVAIGGALLAGLDLNNDFAVGIKAGFYSDMEDLTTIEPLAFFRYYLPLPKKGLFAQAEVGGTFLFELDEVFPAFSGGIAVGWRFDFNRDIYIEPMARFGYPFRWGAGLKVVIQIPLEDRSYRPPSWDVPEDNLEDNQGE